MFAWGQDSKRKQVSSYAIDDDSSPTAIQLDEWGRNLMSRYSQLDDFQPPIMDKFLFAYCAARPHLPLVSSFTKASN